MNNNRSHLLRPLVLAVMASVSAALVGQSFSNSPCTGDDANKGSSWFSTGSRACEIRRTTLPLVDGRISVDGQNGSIEVTGESRQDIALEAKVTVQGGSQSEADSTLHEITIDTQGTIHARGPHWVSGHGWSVSYRLRVPHHVAAKLKTENGSLTLGNLDGAIEANTTNGSLKFSSLAGDVHAQTTNGSINASLDGTGWQGRGLSATTTNGGIAVTASPNYSAHLIASTTNGGVNVGNSKAISGHGRNVDTQLGGGGATLIFQTTNGGISIR